MSYLQSPRLQFSGKFQADPSTVNNDPQHFNTPQFQTSYDLPGPGASNGWWNPNGTGAWRLYDCSVKRVYYLDGTFCDDPAQDPVVGLPVTGADGRAEGKIVDLDPEQQMVSELWGFQVIVGNDHTLGFKGDYKEAAFGDIWVRYAQGQPDSFFGAQYQSILSIKKWVNLGESRFMKELASVSATGVVPEKLSIKFNVDGFQDDSTQPDFTLGRVVGTIGQQGVKEPDYFTAGRMLSPVPGAPFTSNIAYCIVDKNVLTIDLGNSMPCKSPGGPPVDNGKLYLGVTPANGTPVSLTEIRYLDPGWYTLSGGLVSITLTSEQATMVASNPLAIFAGYPGVLTPTVLSENSAGTFVRADKFVFRMDPGEQVVTKFYATAFGQPMPNAPITLIYDPTTIEGQIKQGPVSGPTNVGQPQSAFTFPTSITTGADGTVELTLTAANPGNPRKYIDGQVYGVAYQLGTTPPIVGAIQNGNQLLNAHVFTEYKIPDVPNWVEHVQPIFQQYADLYPIMRPIVDLSDYAQVRQRINILKNVFHTPISSPNYMPVTRDLSGGKLHMIRKWLDNPVYMNLDSVENLHRALQTAIELEHSTIPPYLCALYSIKPDCNIEVSGLIRSVVIEEMLHMALVCNIMISLGGSPNINHSRFVPKYPGSLPGGLRAGLTVRLRRCSIDQIRDCFMSIEEPEEIIQQRFRSLRPALMGEESLYTIGWFYDQLKKALVDLNAMGKLKFGNVDKQVSDWSGMGKLYVITSLEDALNAIDEIMDQGEGTKSTNPYDGQGELAHYYKFAEIVNGHHIVSNGETYTYTGTAIPFDPAGVYPMADDPQPANYPKGSTEHILASQFAHGYQALLNGLHRTFNGEPHFLREAIGSMYSLDLLARKLMQTPSGLNDGTTAGPAFQLPYVM